MRRLTPAIPLLIVTLGVAGCGGGPEPVVEPIDPAEQRLTQYLDAAYTAYQAHEYEQAARLYGNALDHARAADDAASIADAAYNRAACFALLEDWQEADDGLSEALLRAPAGEPRADVLMLRASVLRRLDRPSEAEAAIVRALSETEGATPERHRFAADVLRGHLACDRSDVTAAERYAASAEASPAVSDLATKALRARIADARDKPGEAGAIYDLEADLARDAGRYRQMARALGDAGADYAEAGAWEFAADRHYRSARAYLSQDDRAAARRQADAAAEAAERAEVGDLNAAIVRLGAELNEAGATP